eukprot:10031296-Karenia_brevis.AAC.1
MAGRSTTCFEYCCGVSALPTVRCSIACVLPACPGACIAAHTLQMGMGRTCPPYGGARDPAASLVSGRLLHSLGGGMQMALGLRGLSCAPEVSGDWRTLSGSL